MSAGAARRRGDVIADVTAEVITAPGPAPLDVQKFPLRMKDNDLLVTELYRDPSEDAVTALSVYLTPKTSKSRRRPRGGALPALPG